jgi:hypothetical protein
MAWARSPADRAQYHLDTFVQGLAVLTSFTETKFLATGHGPVLQGHIGEFLHDLLIVGTDSTS